MEVVGAVHDDETMRIYLTLKDEIGNRVDESTRIEAINVGAKTGSERSEQIHFDEGTKTATFCVQAAYLEDMLPEELFTISVHTVLSGLKTTNGLFTGETVSSLATKGAQANQKAAPIYFAPERGYSVKWGGEGTYFANYANGLIEKGKMPVMARLKKTIPVLMKDWVSFSGAGIIEDRFHLQYSLDVGVKRYNNVDFYLDYPSSKSRDDLSEVELLINDNSFSTKPQFAPIVENVFELPLETPMQAIRIMANVQEWDVCLQGVWSASFALNSNSSTKTVKFVKNLNGFTSSEVVLSTMGVALRGTEAENMCKTPNIEIEAFTKNGTKLDFAGGTFASNEDDITLFRLDFAFPQDVKNIERVLVNGTEILFTD